MCKRRCAKQLLPPFPPCRYQWHGTGKLLETLQELHDEAQREMEEVRLGHAPELCFCRQA